MQNILNYQANPTPELGQIYGFVYRIENNVNNKVYIGQTTQKLLHNDMLNSDIKLWMVYE